MEYTPLSMGSQLNPFRKSLLVEKLAGIPLLVHNGNYQLEGWN